MSNSIWYDKLAKLVNEFGVEPADANWQAIMPDLPDNQLK